jgi:hypothetical protein
MSGEHPYLMLELEMRVDGDVLPEPYDRASLASLVRSAREPGTHFIFTCTCSVPECAGYYRGIEVAHEPDTIRWADGDADRSFAFEADRYRAEVGRALELATALLDWVTDERVFVNWDERELFPEWNEGTELVMRDWESEYQRRRGVQALPGESSGLALYAGGCWEGLRLLIRSAPGSAWHMFKWQRKAEWNWLREKLGRGHRD